jgi:hypothetical protein
MSATYVLMELRAVGLAAAAAIAFTVCLLVAAPPAVAQSVLPGAAWAEFTGCHRCLLPMEHRISAEPTLRDSAPAATLTPIQSTQAISPIPAPFMTIPVLAASEEPDQPWWQIAVQYAALVIIESLIAWRVGLSFTRASSARPVPSRPLQRRGGRIGEDMSCDEQTSALYAPEEWQNGG